MTSAGSVVVAWPENHRAGGGSSPTSALHDIRLDLIPHWVAKRVLRRHYLGTLAGGSKISFGTFLDCRLEGAVTLGAGPINGHRIVVEATSDDCLCLTRLWLSDRLPRNAESRVLGIVARLLRRHTAVKFLLSYADPAHGHRGVVYQGAGWTYAGMSSETDLYRIGNGEPQHSRSLSHRMGSHSLAYLRSQGLQIEPVRQQQKHKYVLFLDPSWKDRLIPEPKPYPKEL